MKNSVWVAGLVLLLVQGLSGVATTAQAQGFPACAYLESDDNDDGYGWENRATCLITADSMPRNGAECVDDDGDGWGWDGMRVCRVDVECYDTDPIGDGWGWNGSTSCKVTPYAAPFSELEVLRSNIRSLSGDSLAVATLVCNWNETTQLMDMFSDGRIIYTISGVGKYYGQWSTGFSDTDGLIYFRYSGSRASLQMQPGTVVLRGAGRVYDSDDCFWAI